MVKKKNENMVAVYVAKGDGWKDNFLASGS